MPAHVPLAAIDLQISTVTYGTWHDWRSWAPRLKFFSAQQQKTYDLGYQKRLRSHHILKSVFVFLICEYSVHTYEIQVDRTWHCFHKQCAKWFFYFCHLNDAYFVVHCCINLQFNFQQTQPHWNIYRHIFIVSCILATMPVWQFVFWLSTKGFGKPDRKCARVCYCLPQ